MLGAMETATPIPPGIEFVESPPVPGAGRAKIGLILTLVFFAALGTFLYVVLHGESVDIRNSANQFDAALVANDASAAPKGGAKYVPIVHKRFGHVSTARIVHRENVCGSCGSSSGGGSSHWNVDVLIRSHRGLALLRIAYGGASTTIEDVIELGPGTIPSKDLGDAQEEAVVAAYAQRRVACLKRAGDDAFERDDCAEDDLDFAD
jgi:hypothetical protein